MNRYKGVIFDLDGTLLDTLSDISNSVNEVLASYGYPIHAKEEYRAIIDKDFHDLIEQSMPEDIELAYIEEGVEKFIKAYHKNYKKETKPYGGIVSLLKAFNHEGMPIAVNSNKRNDYTNKLLRYLFPDVVFSAIYGERAGFAKKPDPLAALEIAKQMQLDSKEVLYVGDSKTDMLTAKNAGMDSIGVLWGFRDEVELSDHNVTYVVKQPQDIYNIVFLESATNSL
ncbi:HAD family hydrolase [Pelosinus propionicus]|uniref:Phosphoglycolate phosphatase n=1 Tax=Pelosinus propionicus DSM 13327 TaxID=1123291 RepID=A0A1I4I1G9_9FIRM|nr:HAD family hydrolase [Pelosinus propionicus]SFL47803.1 phosphoglycolate phosphatase [Pelosinus propionicus DSM 13327]